MLTEKIIARDDDLFVRPLPKWPFIDWPPILY